MSRATTITITAATSLALTLASTANASGQSDAIAGTVMTAAALGFACGAMAVTDEEAGEDEGEQAPYSRRGPLVAIGANAAVGPLGEGSKLANDAYGLHASAGYRCNGRVASEFEVERHTGYEPVGGVDYRPTVVTSNARVYVLKGRIQPYVLFGGGLMWVSTRGGTTGFAIRAGSGLDFYLNESFVLNGKLDYVRAFQAISGTDYLTLSLGVGYRF